MESKKYFYLSDNKKIAGVCAGISEYFNIDVTLVRIIFIAFLFSGVLSGFILIVYFALWVSAPKKPV
ncbi:MAG: PspC domain-containing protein [Elusimicrobiales bacterium]|nr:PspC domain-containing protein [Elusimicrobiales bacterium]HOJ85728.1 PspC domain-containing protein [Elusimicrobiales bacterium]HOL62602.1 PspC domain-containing protein [Elusimicrobiales bacterium]HPO95755.1 PspC domain-containing protein [Elusimicrobiales bacterium]